MGSDRNTFAVYNLVHTAVYLITVWGVFLGPSLSLLWQSNQHRFSRRAKAWVEAKLSLCLKARVSASPYLLVVLHNQILVEWTHPASCYCLFKNRQNQSLRKSISFLKIPIWHDFLLFISTYCNGLYILKFSDLMKVLEFKIINVCGWSPQNLLSLFCPYLRA